MTPIADYAGEFHRYRAVAEKAFAQVPDEALNHVPSRDGNSIAMLVRHMSGNLRSRFTDFLTSDGEKPWRHRDMEFEERPYTRHELEAMWRDGWAVVDHAFEELTDADLSRTVHIRNEALTVNQALSRALAHQAYHVGQIVLLSRVLATTDWKWITIPKGQSEAYNRAPTLEKPSAMQAPDRGAAPSAGGTHPIQGLHHVTATVDTAQADLDFCTGVLGLRLLKKTVNFDNHSVYHFYYGNESGAPGTIWTTFPYHGWGVAAGQKGAGQVRATSFSVPPASLDAWARRLRERGVKVKESGGRFDEGVLTLTDPSGLTFELIGTDRDARTPWTTDDTGADVAIRGLHSVTLLVNAPDATVEFMTGVLGFAVAGQVDGRVRLSVNGDVPGHTMDVTYDRDVKAAVNGLGTVHHVAMAIPTAEDQLRLRQDLVDRGVRVTEVMDRQYFQSIYFREPGGVLFEVATMGPGFAVDEPLPKLGQTLKLPPWEEPNRQKIEATLPPVSLWRRVKGRPV